MPTATAATATANGAPRKASRPRNSPQPPQRYQYCAQSSTARGRQAPGGKALAHNAPQDNGSTNTARYASSRPKLAATTARPIQSPGRIPPGRIVFATYPCPKPQVVLYSAASRGGHRTDPHGPDQAQLPGADTAPARLLVRPGLCDPAA